MNVFSPNFAYYIHLLYPLNLNIGVTVVLVDAPLTHTHTHTHAHTHTLGTYSARAINHHTHTLPGECGMGVFWKEAGKVARVFYF